MGKPAFASLRAELLAAATVLISVEASAAAPDSQTTSAAHLSGSSADQPPAKLDWQSPGSLRWTFPRTPAGAMHDALGPVIGRTPFSGLKLFDGGRVSAEWSADGRIRYRISGPTPLGANVGGTLSTNAAKVKFSWTTSK
jgi:hypothetical protein